jgi:hypothetical protein
MNKKFNRPKASKPSFRWLQSITYKTKFLILLQTMYKKKFIEENHNRIIKHNSTNPGHNYVAAIQRK